MILDSIIPVFFVMALGYLAGWTRDIDNHHVAELNALVMDFALPASLFVAMVQTPRSLLLEQGQLMIVLAVSMLAIYGLHFWLQRSLLKLDSRQTSVESLTTGLPNLRLGRPAVDQLGLWSGEYGLRRHLHRGGVDGDVAADTGDPGGRRQDRQGHSGSPPDHPCNRQVDSEAGRDFANYRDGARALRC